MTQFEEEDNRLTKVFLVLSALLLISFTALDILNVFSTISDSLKLSGIVLCFLYTVSLLFLYGVDADRTALVLSMFFAAVADVFLLFTKNYLAGVLFFCLVQGFHSIRIFSIHRSTARMNGRIFSSYRSYKVWKAVLFQISFQLIPAAAILVAAQFVEIPDAWLAAAALFYAVGFLQNLIRTFRISHDVRLLDDMRPLRYYAFGMLLYFICDLLLAVTYLAPNVPFLHVLVEYIGYIRLFIWPFYLTGMVMVAVSGARRQNFYS